MRRVLIVLLSTCFGFSPFGASYAQNPQTAPPGVTRPPVASPSAPTPPPEKLAPPADSKTGKPTLSDKLAQQGGTLQPPKTGDRGAVIKPKNRAENMPVISPPGTPGGNQKVVPR